MQSECRFECCLDLGGRMTSCHPSIMFTRRCFLRWPPGTHRRSLSGASRGFGQSCPVNCTLGCLLGAFTTRRIRWVFFKQPTNLPFFPSKFHPMFLKSRYFFENNLDFWKLIRVAHDETTTNDIIMCKPYLNISMPCFYMRCARLV